MVDAVEALSYVGIQSPFGFLVDENIDCPHCLPRGERPGRKPSLLGSKRASPSGSKANLTTAWRARSWRVGIPRGLVSSVPGLGIRTRRTGWATEMRLSVSAKSNLSAGVKECTPSTPAVAFPRLSCVTRRTANSTTLGSVNARLELKHPPLDLLPVEGVPSIPRLRVYRVHSVCAPPCPLTLQPIGLTSASPGAFPQAFAS